jgi:hypothetical protein
MSDAENWGVGELAMFGVLEIEKDGAQANF